MLCSEICPYRGLRIARIYSEFLAQSAARLWSGDRDDKFIERDRKIAYTLSGRVINRVRNRCGDSSYTDFAGPTSSNWIENRVRLTDEMDIDVRHVDVSSY